MGKSPGFLLGRIIFLVFLKLSLLSCFAHCYELSPSWIFNFLLCVWMLQMKSWSYRTRERKATLTESSEDFSFVLPFCK